jgi:hypothetical protein
VIRGDSRKESDEKLTKNTEINSVGRSYGFEEANEVLWIGVKVETARQNASSQLRR